MNIILHELKAYRKSTFIWICSLIIMVVFFLSLFPSISKDFDEFSKILEGYPEGVRKALGLELESFGSILGFYSYVFLYVTLCGAIQAMNLGTSIISKEIREKTADFLLTKPVTRTKVLTSKLIAAVFSLVITDIFYTIAATLMANQVDTKDDFSVKLFLMISMTLLFLQLIFLAIGIVIAVVFPKIKAVLSISLGTVFAFFIIGMVVSDGNEAKRYLSPFKYFDAKYIIEHTKFELSFLVAAIIIVIVSITTSYLIYTKRDIHTV